MEIFYSVWGMRAFVENLQCDAVGIALISNLLKSIWNLILQLIKNEFLNISNIDLIDFKKAKEKKKNWAYDYLHCVVPGNTLILTKNIVPNQL